MGFSQWLGFPAKDQADSAHLPKNDSTVDDTEEHVITARTWAVYVTQAFSYFCLSYTLGAAGFFNAEITATVGGAGLALWISQSFQVVNAVLSPSISRLGDYYGRKYIVCTAALFGMAGNFVIASGKSIGAVIAGATVFGIFFCSSASAFAIGSEILPRRMRGIATVFAGVGGNTGVVVALFAGAGFIQNESATYPGWRGIFWLGGSLIALYGILTFMLYKPTPAPYQRAAENLSFAKKVSELDTIGSLFLAGALIPLLMGLIWGGSTYPWSSGRIIALLTVGCVMLVVLACHQIFFEKHGLFDHRMFRSRNTIISLICVFVEGMVYIIYNQYYGEMTAILYERRLFPRSARFAAFPLANCFASPLVAYTTYRFKVVKPQLIVGFLCFLIGTIGLATTTPGSSKVAVFYCCLSGFGFSAPINLIVTVIQLAVEPDYIGLASALCLVSRSVGGAVGTAIAGAVFQAKISSSLPSYIARAALQAGLPESSLKIFVGGIASSNATLALSAPGASLLVVEKGFDAALHAYSYSFHFIWIVLVPFIVVATISVCLLEPVSDSMTQRIDRPTLSQYEHDALEHNVHIEAGTHIKANIPGAAPSDQDNEKPIVEQHGD